MITAEELLKPISDEQPCGEDLYYDPGFQELETLMKGKEETQFSAAEEPDWRKLHERCVELYGRTKDLRVATAMCLSAVKVDGLAGLKEALTALKEMVERYWEPVHPLLDPEDGNDPLHRMNVLAALSTPRGTFGDPMRFLDRLCEAPLADSPQLGRFSLADITRSEAGETVDGKAPPSREQIEGAFRDTDPEVIKANHQLAAEMVQVVTDMDTFITNTVGSGKAPNLDLLTEQFKEIQKALVPHLPEGTVQEVSGEDSGVEGAGEAVGGAGAKPISGEIRSRQDVIRMLEKICDYYAKTEPSSPVPGVVRRAKRLAEMSFMDIIKDMCPDAETTVRTITGEKEEAES